VTRNKNLLVDFDEWGRESERGIDFSRRKAWTLLLIGRGEGLEELIDLDEEDGTKGEEEVGRAG
jgi:hypothetical protein